MVPFHSCYICVTWQSKEVDKRGEVLKASFCGWVGRGVGWWGQV